MMLGPYKLNQIYTGECCEAMALLPNGCIDLIITSPFYNCRKQYGRFDDQMPWPAYYEFMGRFLDQCYRVLVTGGVLAINIPGVVRWQAEHRFSDTWGDFDPDYKTHRNGQKVIGKGRVEPVGFTVFDMMRQRDNHIREPIIWVKGSDGNAISGDYRMGCDSDPYMRPSHEFILLGSKERWFHRGGTGRRGAEAVPFSDETKDVWFIPPVTSRLHPATFPEELPLRLIRLFTHAADSIILDPFIGSGSTAIAAVKIGRHYLGFDISEKYVNLARRRVAITQLPLFMIMSEQSMVELSE